MSYLEVRCHPSSQFCATSRLRCSSGKTSPSTVLGQETEFSEELGEELSDVDRGAKEQSTGEKAGSKAVRGRLRPILCFQMGQMLYFVREFRREKARTTVSVAFS